MPAKLCQTLAITLLLSPVAAGAQTYGPGVATAVGVDLTGRHTGPSVEMRVVAQAGARWSHELGVSLTAGVNVPGNLDCAVAPQGGCVEYGPALAAVFYEPRLLLRASRSGVMPFVGPRLSLVRGWGGIGAGVAGAGGLEVRFAEKWQASASAVGGVLATRAAGQRGEDWGAFRAGLHLGIGTSF